MLHKLVKKSHVFMIGDRLRYPHHGTGVITGIEMFRDKHFYCIEMDEVDMRILVPMEKINKVGAVFLES